ncbi:uncharacterized protein TRIVIDRAFT_59217 [Trichoderma virens Gv29-8]|uniref:Terpene synthase n=1 Tax=Hypocrea virens (strain Gv29-8 / FGSC 10586) TaxID=413071 RepID=G9MXH0_HYPVG|nr:uncharacterized protein TRIVIDRAFT_59217 [Trichoderma virens Gv29-8]EHK20868.1 hypothetical protein TRIVIDRAFT_59217 [Trichoderma virens Gv29-8]UKZ56865.1 hypothetical protein TrVGV298_010710 [Trichoderma virens]
MSSTVTVLEPTLLLDASTASFQLPKISDPRRHVLIPDLFSSIMAAEPAINPHYQDGKAEADEWFKKLLRLTGKEEMKFNKTDFGFATAIWAPSAERDRFRTAVDWSNWVFYFDDQFDEGHLANHPVKAQEEIDRKQTSPICVPDHLGSNKDYSHLKYLESLIYQSKLSKGSPVPALTVDEYMNNRRRTSRVVLAIRLVEYAEDIRLSHIQIDHPSLQVSNDILSYKKEVELDDARNNLITILKSQLLSDQEAMNKIGKMLDDCYKSWHSAVDELPTWGEEIDRDVLKYLEACHNVGLGNLHWR